MDLFCDECTVYTRETDPVSRTERWQRHILRRALWQSGGAVTERKDPRAGSVLLYVPATACDEAGWSPREGDLILRGRDEEDEADFASLQERGACTVVSAAEHRYGSPALHHWEVCAR